MKYSAGHTPDVTGDTAVGDVSGESLFAEVLSRIEDEFERVLILAHVGLDISLNILARELKVDRRGLASRVGSVLDRLREDEELAGMLGNVHRAGNSEHYQALAFRLDLQDWFCSHCGEFMVQSEIGRPRKTCSNSCRGKFFRADGTGWKDQYQPGSLKKSDTKHSRTTEVPNAEVGLDKILELLRPVELADRRQSLRTFWWEPHTQSRDRALLLLGFMCPIPLSSSDLAMLDVDDVAQKPGCLEVRLYRRAKRATRYVTIPAGVDKALCPVEAMSAWRGLLVRSGRTIGPLFVRMGRNGRLPRGTVRVTDRAVTKVFTNAAQSAEFTYIPELRPFMSIPGFLSEISLPI
jgi:hypothetical protein